MGSQHPLAGEAAPTKIPSFLKTLLKSNRTVEDFIERSFRAVTPEVLEYWIRNDLHLIPDTTRKLYFEHPLVRPVFKMVVERNWPLIEHYLRQPDTAIEKLVECNPANKAILESERARGYIQKQVKEAYDLFNGLLHG